MCKVSAAEGSLFSKVLDINRSVTKLNTDIEKISPRAYRKVNGKCSLTLIPTKKGNEIIFSHKLVSNNLSHPPAKFNNNYITRCSHQKHFRSCLGFKS